MTNEQKLELLIKVLKQYAEQKHCYDRNPSLSMYDFCSVSEGFDDGADYGETTFARILLEQIGEEFEYPCIREEE